MNANKAQKLQDFLELSTLNWIGLVIAILILAAFVHYIRAWYRDGDDPEDTNDQILDQIEDLHLQGDLTDEEFRSIKSQITGRNDG